MFSRPVLGALGAFALLAACGGKQAPAPAAAVAACAGVLPVTGLCPEAGISAFGKINPIAELQQPGCVWRTMEAKRAPDEVLVLRGQDCTKAGAGAVSFTFPTSRELHISSAASPGVAAVDAMVATILDIAAGQTAEDAAGALLAEAPEAERATCEPRAMSGEQPVAGRPFQLQPDEATLNAMHRREDGPVSACGTYGYAEDFQELWEGRAKYAIYHSLGQDTAPWDPMSFTFYRRGADGVWLKQPN